MEWMLMPLKRSADFSGRSRRKEYWMFTLLNIVVITVLMVLMGVGGGVGGQNGTGALSMVAVSLLVLYSLAVLVPSIAVQVRRFHDQCKSGWYVLLGLIPWLGGVVVLVFMLMEGTRDANAYGPDPKQA
ncbi:DUF805 domain-containing protein [Xanthomonas translucens pv. translucens]|uniref:DUF805 domain-containing protein n=1 Tax=Xanthomonas campestris pv. translucens TaxID=343 RepID=UPI0019D5CDE8|nr:DUF805 domain-containing protein [Xanthomonas translucens]MCT8284403.1 DUF805 domain-containing protein [Xanthomonas translucens pv. translucens]MCT8302061.1 DUF805 domain-containing protein [Xanthomonas translucens pv. translucens]QSQ32181.1 DUF805 domain-containing protein [Xanthomonas translucens pv. translucens]